MNFNTRHHIVYANKAEATVSAPTLADAQVLYPEVVVIAVTVTPAPVPGWPNWHKVNVMARTATVEASDGYGGWRRYHEYRSISEAKAAARRLDATSRGTVRVRATRAPADVVLGWRV